MMNSILTTKTTSSKNRSLQIQTDGSFRTNILYPDFILFIFARLIREYVPIYHCSNKSKKFCFRMSKMSESMSNHSSYSRAS